MGQDLLKLCEIATEVKADASMPDGQKPVEIATRFKTTGVQPETRKIMRGLAGVAPDRRQQHLIDEAAEHGVDDYKCSALD